MMIFLGFLSLSLLYAQILGFNLSGKEYEIYKTSEGEVTKSIVYSVSSSSEKNWIVKSIYNNSYLKTGWDTLDIETNPEAPDAEQALIAGYIEGVDTSNAIYDHWYNTVSRECDNKTDLCEQINEYLYTNIEWVFKMVEKHAATDVYWRQVKLFYQQIEGMSAGYNSTATAEKTLSVRDILWMNFELDFNTLKSALRNKSDQAVKGFDDHCSALVKVLHGHSDILVSHNTWTGYETMRRIMKRYTLPLRDVSSKSMSFSGYPGELASGDDFYILSSGLVAQETTNINNNKELWSLLKPEGQVLEVVRATVANRLAWGGRSWAKVFSQYNSGTYNNQWMIVDMKKFSPGSVAPELLYVIEQMPGYIRAQDQTDLLLREGYWASYNRPFYPEIFNISGHKKLVQKYGDFFTHDKTSRALIFKRDQGKVVDINSLMTLMRSNNFMNDPYSRCDCNPPYSAVNAIAARHDLNPANGTYNIPALGHGCTGATDAKVTNFTLSKSLSLLAVSGPSTGTNLPPFQWSKSDYDKQYHHRGHPDLFNFQPVLITWPSQLSIIMSSKELVSQE